ncbi:MAG TPA: flagellar hook-length control protein FliK [Steroidobacter sp.]
MTPPSVPPSPAAAAASPAPGASSATAPEQPGDFLLSLAQFIAGSVAQAGSASAAPQLPGKSDGTQPDELDPEELIAMLSVSLPVSPEQVRTETATAQSLATLEATSGSGSKAVDAWAAQSVLASTADASVEAVSPSGLEGLMQAVTESQGHRPAHGADAIARPVHVPVGSGAWADEIGSRLLMMAEQGGHTASLRLSPEHLGPLEISISVRGDEASVWFGAAHADTRAAIEHALPRLREMLEAQGLSLTDAGVFKEAPRGQQSAPVRAGGLAPSSAEEGSEAVVRVALGLVDAYA